MNSEFISFHKSQVENKLYKKSRSLLKPHLYYPFTVPCSNLLLAVLNHNLFSEFILMVNQTTCIFFFYWQKGRIWGYINVSTIHTNWSDSSKYLFCMFQNTNNCLQNANIYFFIRIISTFDQICTLTSYNSVLIERNEMV